MRSEPIGAGPMFRSGSILYSFIVYRDRSRSMASSQRIRRSCRLPECLTATWLRSTSATNFASSVSACLFVPRKLQVTSLVRPFSRPTKTRSLERPSPRCSMLPRMAAPSKLPKSCPETMVHLGGS